MGKLKSFVAGALLGGAGMYVGLQYHVLQAEEGFLIVPRTPQQRMQDAYADIRDWDAATWTARPSMALALTDYGRGDLITEGAATRVIDDLRESLAPLRQQFDEVSTGWEPASTTSNSPVPRSPEEPARTPEPTSSPPVRRGFLPLAELFGVGKQPQSQPGTAPRAQDITPVLPAGVSQAKEVEILPTPGDFEILPEPDEVHLGPSSPIPGSIRQPDRRRSDASDGWEPVRVQSF